jgi:HlyD family secretion protein
VLFIERPVFGQENSTVSLFKYDADGKYAQQIKVTFGKAAVSTIEVKSGLNIGDRVILSDMSNYDQYQRIKID